MKKIIVLFAFLGLVTNSEDVFTQITHYTGTANVVFSSYSVPSNCGGAWSNTNIYDVHYTVFHRNGLRDSISYTMIRQNYPTSTLQAATVTNDTFYLKNDADSIVFPFQFYDTYNTAGGPIGTECNHVTFYESYTGIARIPTSTAGVSYKANEAPFEFFPNPTNDFLHLNSVVSHLSIYDNLGRLQMTQEWNDESESRLLDVSTLPSGCYTILFESSKERSSGKFIKY